MNLYAFDDFDLGKGLLRMSKAPEWVLQDDLGWILCTICFCQKVVCYHVVFTSFLFSLGTQCTMHNKNFKLIESES